MPTKRPRGALYGIVAAVFVSGTGIGSLLPILPLFLRERGASYSLVGLIVGAALAAQAVGQWPAGWLAERIGRKEMMVVGLLVAAAASLMFLLPLSIEWLVAVRFLQGLGFAAAAPAEIAAVADVVAPEELGRAYGWVSAARQSGIIVGPAIGGVLAVFGRWTVFAVTGGALAAAALVAALTLPRSVRRPRAEVSIARVFMRSTRVGVALRAVVTMTIGLGLLIGIYDVIWSLYMRQIGASDFVIGLSFTLFALPLVAATPFAGWASDRWDRRWLAFSSVAVGRIGRQAAPALVVETVEAEIVHVGDRGVAFEREVGGNLRHRRSPHHSVAPGRRNGQSIDRVAVRHQGWSQDRLMVGRVVDGRRPGLAQAQARGHRQISSKA